MTKELIYAIITLFQEERKGRNKMWSKELLKFSLAVYKQFGDHPIDNIQADYDKITFQVGRVLYQYDYETEIISRIK